jgi:hypothetical protein
MILVYLRSQIVPAQIAFAEDDALFELNLLFVLDRMCDLGFIFDWVLTFFVAYPDRTVVGAPLVRDLRLIQLNYLKNMSASWQSPRCSFILDVDTLIVRFLFDTVSNIPFDLLLLVIPTQNVNNQTLRILRMLRLLKLTKLLRLLRSEKIIGRIQV